MTKVIRVATLVFVLSVCTQAGIMQTDKTEPPPPPPASVTQEEPEPEASAEGITQNDLSDALSQATLGVLQSLLTLF